MATIRETTRRARRRIVIIPLAAFLLLGSGLAALWVHGTRKERERDLAQSEIVATQLQQRIEDWVDARLVIMESLAARWKHEGEPSERSLRLQADAIVAWYPGFRAVNWIDPSGTIRIVNPLEGNEPALGKNLYDHPDPDVPRALWRAAESPISARTRVIELLQGGKGIAVYRACAGAGGEAGFINGVFGIPELTRLWTEHPDFLDRFNIHLREDTGETVFTNGSEAAPKLWPYRSEIPVRVVDRRWLLTVAPTREHRASGKIDYGQILLALGLVLCAGGSLLLGRLLSRQQLLRSQELRGRYLLDWSRQLQSAESYERIGDVTLSEIRARLGYDLVFAFVIGGEDNDEWHRLFTAGVAGDYVRDGLDRIRVDEATLFSSVMGSTEITAIDDVRGHSAANQEMVRAIGARSVFLAPLRLVDQRFGLFGGLTVDETGVRSLSDSETDYLAAMAGHLSQAISRVRYVVEQQQADAQRARLERQMLEAQKLESLGILAGGIAHDFNNILVAILGNADLARLDMEQGKCVPEYMDQIVDSAKRAADLCAQMLAYSGGGYREMRAIDLNAVVGDMAELLKVSVSKNARIRATFDESLPPVHGDTSQLSQVAMNLITNASDAIGERSGTIRIATGTALLDREALDATVFGDDLSPGSYVFLEVSDDGAGMEPRTLQRIFDPFFTTKSKGHGLGLAAVLGIVRSHGGTLAVSSTRNRGSVFTLYLRATDESPRALEAPHAVTAPVEPLRVLVVDDELPVRQVTRGILERAGHKVVDARDGETGLSVFRDDPQAIDLAIVDLTMPGLAGPQVIAALRDIREDLPVILASGYAENLASQDLRELQLLGFVAKPFTAETLLGLVNRVRG